MVGSVVGGVVGSVVVLDGYGSAVTLAGGNVQVSAARHLSLEAAGDLNLIAGQNINLKARRSSELVATKGGLTFKAKAWLRHISTHGSIWFRSDAKDPLASGYTSPTADDPAEDPVPEVLPAAIVFQTTSGRFAVEAKNAVDISVKARDLPGGEDATITLRSDDGAVKVHAGKDVHIDSLTKNVNLKAAGSVVAAGRNFLVSAFGAFDVNNTFTVRHGVVNTFKLVARQVVSSLVMSRKMKMADHENHVNAIPTGQENSPGFVPQNFGTATGDDIAAKDLARDLYSYRGPAFPSQDASGNRKPGFDVRQVTGLIETVTQQRLRLEEDPLVSARYGTWTWAQDQLPGEMNSPQGYPWPGNQPQDLQASGGAALRMPSGTSYDVLDNEAPELQKRPKLFRFLTTTES